LFTVPAQQNEADRISTDGFFFRL